MTLQRRLDALVSQGRKEAERLYGDHLKGSVHWVEEHLPRLRREAEQEAERAEREAPRALDRGARAVRKTYDEHLRAPVSWIEDRLPTSRSAASILLPTVVAAAGAGVAFWWWTQWARGQAERAAADAAGGAAGKAHPESVMAHAPPPADAPAETPDASTRKLAEPAEDVMAHVAPPAEAEPAGGTLSRGAARPSPEVAHATAGDASRLLGSTSAAPLQGGVEAVLPAAAAETLDETLAVQAAAKPRKAKPAGPALN